MRRGCIAISEVKCNGCDKTIQHAERYLAVEEEDRSTTRLCFDCCLKHGYAGNWRERGQEFTTFFLNDFTDMGQASTKPPKEKDKDKEKEEKKD